MTADQITSLLNELLEIDPAAVDALMVHSVPCNRAVALHSTIQVRVVNGPARRYRVGLLGILNGLAGCNRRVEMVTQDDRIVRFQAVDYDDDGRRVAPPEPSNG